MRSHYFAAFTYGAFKWALIFSLEKMHRQKVPYVPININTLEQHFDKKQSTQQRFDKKQSRLTQHFDKKQPFF